MLQKTRKKNEKLNKKGKKGVNQKADKFDFNEEMVIGLKKAPDEEKKTKKKKKEKLGRSKNKSSKTFDRPAKFDTKAYQGAKSRNKKKKPQSKLKKIIIKSVKYIIILFMLTAMSIFFMLSPLFNITKIDVKGNSKISSALIIDLSGILLNENTFKINKNRAIAEIKLEPYIESVKISRSLPSIIEIEVVERQVTYMLEFVNTYAYINNQGYILEISEEKAEVPMIVNFNTPTEDIEEGNRLGIEDLQKLEIILKIIESARNNEVLNYITKIDIADKNDFKLILEGEGKIAYMGDSSSINTRMQYLKTIIEKEQGKRGEVFINGDMNNSSATFREELN